MEIILILVLYLNSYFIVNWMYTYIYVSLHAWSGQKRDLDIL